MAELKRTFDLLASVLILAIVSPLMLLIAVATRATIGSPILFRQMRPGLRGVPFQLMKFRTMRDFAEPNGRHAPDSERITPLGRFLRASSLDELPEFWNVVRGDMSLVGPRPLLMEYLALYTPRQARRHEVRPGITGLAQISGRDTVSWEDKFELDVWYVDHHNFWLDLRILMKTVIRVVRREGIFQQGRATVERFQGTTTI